MVGTHKDRYHKHSHLYTQTHVHAQHTHTVHLYEPAIVVLVVFPTEVFSACVTVSHDV